MGMIEREGNRLTRKEQAFNAGTPGSGGASGDPLQRTDNLTNRERLAKAVSGFGLRLGLGGQYLTDKPIDPSIVPSALSRLMQPGHHIDTRAVSEYSNNEREEYGRVHHLTPEAQYRQWRKWATDWLGEAKALQQTDKHLYDRRERVLQEFGITLSCYTHLSPREQRNYLDRAYQTHIGGATDTDLIAQRLIRAARNGHSTPASVTTLVAHLDAVDAFLSPYGEKAKMAIRELVILKGFQQAQKHEQEVLLTTAPTRINEPLREPQQEILRTVKAITERQNVAHPPSVTEKPSPQVKPQPGKETPSQTPTPAPEHPKEPTVTVTEADIRDTERWVRQNSVIREDFDYRKSLRDDPKQRERELLMQIAKTVKEEEQRIHDQYGRQSRTRPAPVDAKWERQKNTAGVSTCTLASVGNALRALGKYDERLNSEEAMIRLLGGEQFLTRRRQESTTSGINTYEVGRLLKILAEKQGIVYQRTASVADLLFAVEKGAAVVLTLGPGHAGAIQPGERVFRQNGELWTQVVDPIAGERYYRVADWLKSEITYSQGVGTAEAAPAFILRVPRAETQTARHQTKGTIYQAISS